ncbi:hypothetical protein [Sphingobium boeckii]|uniref:Uncharacterized protein n=1 Tax=Sphingobium boeckii TaxID=1082345 RepID=A0A7W9EH17_9SPHN|nr:hypothetical protein [Sphingobium boeckii]MBB5687665.1 hypothetical protein [Sphingobium boeckii]
MADKNPEQLTHVTIRLVGKEDAEQICNMLRGLLLSSKTVELKGITNSRLLRGYSISFGVGSIAQKFVGDVETLFSPKVRERLEIDLHG